ncbi:unnamed protein product [Rhizoctonia solani]|uniref:Chitin synthase export chaperone n=1 Tax=Rhizoctonia solani TaxID=456999 RepID=A0A8H3AXY2_9AGAM|nr:unnamed protein product [Rhizoctonia solani]
MGFKFGSFDDICSTASLVICPLVGESQGIEPTCYSRNVEINGTLIFQPGIDVFCTYCRISDDGDHDIPY